MEDYLKKAIEEEIAIGLFSSNKRKNIAYIEEQLSFCEPLFGNDWVKITALEIYETFAEYGDVVYKADLINYITKIIVRRMPERIAELYQLK